MGDCQKMTDAQEEGPLINLNLKAKMWLSEEHLLYLIFLELNKDKTKSKWFRQ
jgi:hypothetical protein